MHAPLIHSVQLGTTFLCHLAHHFLQPQVASNATNYQDLRFIAVRHCSLCRFHQHCEHRLLRTATQAVWIGSSRHGGAWKQLANLKLTASAAAPSVYYAFVCTCKVV